jgi:arylsulfatase A-like enzyme
MTDKLMRGRDVLPIPDKPQVGLTTYDAKDPDTKFPPIRDVRPSEYAPNVLVILLDDVCFGASSAFGGPCHTPTVEKLAGIGLKYTRFHTTALCSPTHKALLTGRNHHSVGMGGITEIATSSPGYSSVLPNTKAPLARTLTLNGYSTAQFGKCHEVPVWQNSPMGPYDKWPSAGGGLGKGGNITLYYDSQKVGEGRVNETQGYVFSADETTDIGYESGTPVTPDYTVETSKFNGKLDWV